MRRPPFFVSLTMIGPSLLGSLSMCAAHPHARNLHVHHLAGRDTTPVAVEMPSSTDSKTEPLASSATPCFTSSCVAASAPPSCDAANGTAYTQVPEMDDYTIICDIDFPGQNIFPFVLAGSFEECLLQCENFNKNNQDLHCAGFVFAPERETDGDDCYLKSSLNEPSPATIHLIGATLVATASTVPVALPPPTAPLPIVTPAPTVSAAPTSSVVPHLNLPAIEARPGAVSAKLTTPKVSNSQVLGASNNAPTKQYVEHPMALPEKLASSLLVPGINTDLITKYPIASDTGSWTSDSSSVKNILSDLSVVPHLSRDGGKGGQVNGSHLFVFCDTASFAPTTGMVGFVSSSVATNADMNGLDGKALTLVDQVGEWQDDVGRMRGFAPMTTGEEAFNIALSGNGYRYTVWPESSLIPLNQTYSLLYASLVYDEVDMASQAANFTTLGNTLLLVSVDPIFGPGAQRVVNRLFVDDEVAWGSLGGLRLWGPSGVGGMDGMVYVFGQVDSGVLVGRTTPTGIADRSSYSYWDGTTWSSGMLPPDSTAYFLNTPVMDLDVMYSAYHNTFIMVYLTPDADNTFYFRYLEPTNGTLPSYDHGSEDYFESIVKDKWSDEQTLYMADAPPMGYIYAGGVHAGYFGNDDITNGGKKMLLSWTEHTGQDASSPQSGYAHMTVVITFE